jgi:hypothetical protein
MEFPGNSHSARIEQQNTTASVPEATVTTSETKTVKKVVTGKVTQNKETLGRKFKRMFLHDGGDFAGHIVEKIVVPTIKDMALSIATQAVDGVRQGIEEALFGPDGSGSRRSRTTSYGTGRPTVNYTRYSSSSSRRPERDRDRDSYRSRRSNRVKEIIVETREDGDAVLEELDAIIDNPDIGYCTVGDFYAACGENTTPQDEEWGWRDLSKARVHKISRDEFLISMPHPREIEN